jgi:hypothetical protein
MSAPIIDIHCHAAGMGSGGSGCHVTEKLRCNWRFSHYLRAFGVTREELALDGDSLLLQRLSERLAASKRVHKAVVLALDGVVDQNGQLDLARTEVYIPNDYLAAEIRRYPNLLFGASVNPYRKDALERLEQVAADGAVLIKWLPNIQRIDPADERLIPFYDAMKRLGLPLLVHTGAEKSFTTSDNRLGDPRRLRLPLERGVTVIAAHAATTGKSDGHDNMELLFPMLEAYPHLYTDISSLTQLNKLFYLPRLLKKPQLQGKLLYGTDMPLIATPVVSPWYYLGQLPLKEIVRISRIRNPWDRDLAIKESLGVDPSVFTRAAALLKLSASLP